MADTLVASETLQRLDRRLLRCKNGGKGLAVGVNNRTEIKIGLGHGGLLK